MRLRVVRRESPAAHAMRFGADVHPVLQRIYAARGIRSQLELDLSLDRLLPVGTLEGAAAAVDLLLRHRLAGRVLVVGDFDADGATSTALMLRAMRAWGFASVDFLVPNRFEFGYGLTPEIVALAATRSPTLIVTVDNGISSNAGVADARARGMDVLITDHHLPGAVLPAALSRGPTEKPRSAAVNSLMRRFAISSSARIPATQRPARIRRRPWATSTRLLPSSGTRSATVPSATRSR